MIPRISPKKTGLAKADGNRVSLKCACAKSLLSVATPTPGCQCSLGKSSILELIQYLHKENWDSLRVKYDKTAKL